MNYTEPFVPTPEDVVQKMLTLAEVRPGELVFDLGSGDGRLAIAAARDFRARAVGVEIRRRLVAESRQRVRKLGLSGQVKIVCRSFKKVSLRRADVLSTYLSGYTMNLLAPKFTKELKHGARIVNFDYPVSDWTPVRKIRVKPEGWKTEHNVYLYSL